MSVLLMLLSEDMQLQTSADPYHMCKFHWHSLIFKRQHFLNGLYLLWCMSKFRIRQRIVGKQLAGIMGSTTGFSSLTYETIRRDCSFYYMKVPVGWAFQSCKTNHSYNYI